MIDSIEPQADREVQASLVLVVAMISLAFYAHDRGARHLGALLVTCAAGLALTAMIGRRWQFGSMLPSRLRTTSVLVVLLALLSWSENISVIERIQPSAVGRVMMMVLLVGTTLTALCGAMASGKIARWAAIAAVVLHFCLSSGTAFGGFDFTVDVRVFQQMGAEALVDGENPYEVRFPDIYPPELSSQFYGPGVSVDGFLTRGYPYPPASLAPSLIALPTGDVRWAHRLAIAATAALLLMLGRNQPNARLASAAFLLSPGTVWMAIGGWTEAFLGVTLVGVALAWSRHRRLAPFLLGLFLSLKQYSILFLPLLPLLAGGKLTPSFVRRVLWGVMPWAILTAGFALWSIDDFIDATVTWQFVQPFRPDSLSLLVSAVNAWSWPPPSLHAAMSLGAGVLISIVTLLKAPRTVSGWTGAVGTVMLFFVLLSKQAFVNYYFLAITALMASVAGIGAEADDPAASDEVSGLTPA